MFAIRSSFRMKQIPAETALQVKIEMCIRTSLPGGTLVCGRPRNHRPAIDVDRIPKSDIPSMDVFLARIKAVEREDG
jgi:hypothetical protein